MMFNRFIRRLYFHVRQLLTTRVTAAFLMTVFTVILLDMLWRTGIVRDLSIFVTTPLGQLVVDVIEISSIVFAILRVRYIIQRLRRAMPRPIFHQNFRLGDWTPSEDLLFHGFHSSDRKTGRICGIDAIQLVTAEFPATSFDNRAMWADEEGSSLGQQLMKYYEDKDGGFTNGLIARLESIEKVKDKSDNHTVILRMHSVNYFDFVATNLSWENRFRDTPDTLDGGRSLPAISDTDLLKRFRAFTGSWPKEFKSVEDALRCEYLANGITIHMNVIDSENNMLVGVRPKNMAIYSEALISSVSGAIVWNRDRIDKSMAPSPFVAAINEGLAEIGLELPIRDMRFFGLVMQKNQYHPILVGEVQLAEPISRVQMGMGEIHDSEENEEFRPLSLSDLKMCAAVVKHGNWIPASQVAVALSLMVRHPPDRVTGYLSRKDGWWDKTLYNIWRSGF